MGNRSRRIDLPGEVCFFTAMPYGKFFHGETAAAAGHGRNRPDPKRLRRRMVAAQLEARGISHSAVLAAMDMVPRHLFVPEALQNRAYEDSPLPIGFGQTISQPYTVALMTECLEPEQGMHVLEIGTGSGYQAAVLAAMGCSVVSVERVRELYVQTTALLRELGLRAVQTYCGDGTLGMPDSAPFDRIIVTAGGPEIPHPLLGQLAPDGILLIPVGEKPRTQRLLRVRKKNGDIAATEDLGEVGFVNLVGDHGWRDTTLHGNSRK